VFTSADATITYAYGITGMRESKTVETPSGTTWTKSVWAGGRLAAELDSDGTRYTYLWGPDRTPLSVFVERSEGAAETYAYHTDALGSVVAMTDESGSVVARYAYDPATYRFLSPDPAPPSAADPLSLNAYAYCLGDPVGASDPSGAITDWDGDGKASEDEVALHASKHTKNSKLSSYWRAKGKRLHYQLMLTKQRLGYLRRKETQARWLAAAVGEAKAWATLNGYDEYYIDANVTGACAGAGGVVGLTGGKISNYQGGVVVDEHWYGGVAIANPGIGMSVMVGQGRTEPGRRYIEFAAGDRLAVAYGYRSDNDRSAPWDIDAMGQHIADNDYVQGGMCLPVPGGSVSWFYVVP